MPDVSLQEAFTDVPKTSAKALSEFHSLVAGAIGVRARSNTVTQSALMLGAPELASVRDRMQPPSGLSTVHETQRFWREYDGDMNVDRLSVSCDLATASARFQFGCFQGEALTGEIETRLRFVAPQQVAALKGAVFAPRMVGEAAIDTKTHRISSELVQAYVRLAHDDNPIHTDQAAARAAGLSSTVVPGMLLCALVEAAFSNYSNQSLGELKTRFMAGVPVGEAVRLVIAPRGSSNAPWSKARAFCVTRSGTIAAISDLNA
ncbi:MaoC dehydratase-like protein [Shimia isoporae]|uniref:MaoC dehydratase-like protein n=1 Tax=Shimia isoporae TaxID=647720 RepID=A0A4R1N053_9RHOB|nr:MaoC family dehydratase [Shimia isoporae]TCK99008.1 MaoC dehydratase-like protein [Shimia isoporae]